MSAVVALVGAGPGDPDLLTLRARRLIVQADVIVYDHLVNPAVLEGSHAQRVYVGKTPSSNHVTQDYINHLLIQLARDGKKVVRLKSGDPYVFGRGGEECQFLRANNIACEVVPGITSAIAGPAAVGIPVTHRDYAAQFHVITGHRKAGGDEFDWHVLARLEGTTVFLMGMSQLEYITKRLLENGKAKNTPAAVIQWATLPNQRSVKSDLAHIASAARDKQLGPPALIVLGDVVQLMDSHHPPFVSAEHEHGNDLSEEKPDGSAYGQPA